MCQVKGFLDRADHRSVSEQLLEQERREQLRRWIEGDEGRQSDELIAGVLWRNEVLSRENSHKPNGKPFRGRMPTCLAAHLASHKLSSEQFPIRGRIALFPDGTVYEVLSEHGKALQLGNVLVQAKTS